MPLATPPSARARYPARTSPYHLSWVFHYISRHALLYLTGVLLAKAPIADRRGFVPPGRRFLCKCRAKRNSGSWISMSSLRLPRFWCLPPPLRGRRGSLAGRLPSRVVQGCCLPKPIRGCGCAWFALVYLVRLFSLVCRDKNRSGCALLVLIRSRPRVRTHPNPATRIRTFPGWRFGTPASGPSLA